MATVTVVVPHALLHLVGGHDTVTVEATTVGEAVRQVTSAYPPLRRHLASGGEAVWASLVVCLNEEMLPRDLRDATPVREHDRISLIAAVSGG